MIGPKCLKKFKRLMLHRINWNPDKRGDGTYMHLRLGIDEIQLM